MSFLFALFVCATLAQMAVWQFLFGRLARYKPVNNGEKTDLPPVSVLICARNEALNLQKYLPALLEQDYPDFEVLVIDDDSADETQAILAAFQKKYAHLRVLRVSPKISPGKKYALAQGIAAARHEYLVFTDADCEPASREWLLRITDCPETSGRIVPRYRDNPQSEITLGYAPYRPEPGFLNRWIRFETVYTAMQYFSFALAGWPYMGVGRNLAWKKTLFQRVGGFAAHAHILSGDDDLLVNAAAHAGNTAICLAPEAFVYSGAKKNWAAWYRQKRRHLGAGKWYRREHRIALALLTLTLILHYFLLPVLLFSEFGMVSAAFYAVRMALAAGIYWKILRQFRDEQLIIWFPLLDAVLAIYFAVMVPLILIRSNYLISWK
ncbi:MAG: glycosyltransferase [Thermoanaerobaculia bacterium]|nr:glycosyltransferase [Thermoanaerobaculia bacterium]